MAGSKAVIGFWLVDAMRGHRMAAMVAEPLRELVGLVAAGTLAPLPGLTYPLADARRAHEDMTARRTTGKVVLAP
jgi:NADPH2:quinone reductase